MVRSKPTRGARAVQDAGGFSVVLAFCRCHIHASLFLSHPPCCILSQAPIHDWGSAVCISIIEKHVDERHLVFSHSPNKCCFDHTSNGKPSGRFCAKKRKLLCHQTSKRNIDLLADSTTLGARGCEDFNGKKLHTCFSHVGRKVQTQRGNNSSALPLWFKSYYACLLR